MISYSQYQMNKAYNQFLSKLVLWDCLNNKTNADKKQGNNPTKNYEMMKNYEGAILNLLPEIEKLDRSKIRSYFPLVDDVALIQYFKDTVQ